MGILPVFVLVKIQPTDLQIFMYFQGDTIVPKKEYVCFKINVLFLLLFQNRQQASESAQLTQAAARPTVHRPVESTPSQAPSRRRNSIFEPRPGPTYSDINHYYNTSEISDVCEHPPQEQEETPAQSRTPVRYIGAKTDSRLDYSNSNFNANTTRKLVRRETVIASWKYLKNEREKALGTKERYSDVKNEGKPRKFVSRSHSDRQNGGLRKFSSKRKSVIYTFDPIRKVLVKAYKFEADSDDGLENNSGASSSSVSSGKRHSIASLDNEFSCQRSSSFTKIKTLFMRVFNNKSL